MSSITYDQAIRILELIKGAPLQHGDKFPTYSGTCLIGKGGDGMWRGWNFYDRPCESPLWAAREGWELDVRICHVLGYEEAKDVVLNSPYWRQV